LRFPRKRGATSVMIRVFILDSSKTNGAGLTGLTSASTNLTIAYIRELDSASTTYTGANIQTITTIGTFQQPTDSSHIRFKAVDATAFPGLYEIHFHDSATAFGTGDTSQAIAINIYEATTTALNIGPNMVNITLVPWDPTDGVRMGMTALPNTACTGNASLITSGSGTDQLLVENGVADADVVLWQDTSPNALASGRVDSSVGAYPGNTAQTGDNFARLGAPAGASIAADIAEIEAETDGIAAIPTTPLLAANVPANFAALLISGAGHIANVDAVVLPANPPAGFLVAASYGTAPAWYVAPANPTDYQQRGVAVTLPANPPSGFLVAASYSTAPAWYAAPDNADIAILITQVGTLFATRIPGVIQPQTGDSYARLGSPAGASIAADLAEIEAETDALGSAADPLANLVPSSYASGTAGNALGKIGAGQVTYVSPVNPVNLVVTLKRGNDYFAVDGNALLWNLGGNFNDLTAAGITFAAKNAAGTVVLSVTGAVVTPSGIGQQVKAEPTAAQTTTLVVGTYPYDVQAVRSNGHRQVLAYGTLIVQDREDA
jgi:hypothetical protein